MCKLWPGLRCTDHPQKKIQKLAQQIHNNETEISKLQDSLSTMIIEQGEEVKETEEFKALENRRNTILEKVQTLEAKKVTALNDYAMSAGGRKEIKKLIEDENTDSDTRATLIAELQAAENRIEIQKRMGKVLHDDEIDEQDKLVYLQMEENLQKEITKNLRKEHDKNQKLLDAYKVEIDIAKAQGDEKRADYYTKKRQELATVQTLYDKELKQREDLIRENKAYRERIEDRWEKSFSVVGNALISSAPIVQGLIAGKKNGASGGARSGQSMSRFFNALTKGRRGGTTRADIKAADEQRRVTPTDVNSNINKKNKSYFDFDDLEDLADANKESEQPAGTENEQPTNS